MTTSSSDSNTPLAGKHIAVPESRELDLFSDMLRVRGAVVYRCPLVAILDSPNRTAVEAWLHDFVDTGYDDLIVLTGEGLRRLLGFAERAGGNLRERFIAALGQVRTITRGPKPGNALRSVGLKPVVLASAPTTEGVIATLENEDLHNRVVGVQLYGENPNERLVSYLRDRGADVRTVAPYVYADAVDEERVVELIDELSHRHLDAIAFTGTPQVDRLFKVAGRHGREAELVGALNNTLVAAVGPVVAASLEAQGVEVAIVPESSYFMKPLVRQLVSAFGGGQDDKD